MRTPLDQQLEGCRIRLGPMGTRSSFGANCAFLIPHQGVNLRVIASDGFGWTEQKLPGKPWEHVSVSLLDRCPTWDEMVFVKSLFWGDDETVIQLHVPRSDRINHHAYCLHLWKPLGVEIPLPPRETV